MLKKVLYSLLIVVAVLCGAALLIFIDLAADDDASYHWIADSLAFLPVLLMAVWKGRYSGATRWRAALLGSVACLVTIWLWPVAVESIFEDVLDAQAVELLVVAYLVVAVGVSVTIAGWYFERRGR